MLNRVLIKSKHFFSTNSRTSIKLPAIEVTKQIYSSSVSESMYSMSDSEYNSSNFLKKHFPCPHPEPIE
ncbi:hypothetical protein BpHYR1_052908 [Brachionus plicatilis]|uniref:Uncharacterized protein n=1 Tax=Brachionus plicatilis TaxID=10195 RepID=A0A3M7QJ91_BRAPC|nr:hypothetical protein BpHYR1_052908 [Brachionus plicatilis]